jgi:hypothetical protein
MSKQGVKFKFPIIYYEEQETANGSTNPIPYIEVEKEEPWPFVLFIQEYRHTGEYEPDHKGDPAPILDMIMHQYVDMITLKEKLSEETYDIVRTALGMKPLKEAQKEGSKILDKVEKNLQKEKKSSTTAATTPTKTIH